VIDRTSLLNKLVHSKEAIDHCDRFALDRSVLKRCVDNALPITLIFLLSSPPKMPMPMLVA
jgi:hypothetical protein